MARDADPMTGRVLDGRYRVGPRIARGGMATVYEAHDLRLDRECAVKVMHSDLGDDHDFASRFVREAHAAARLSHPNVVSVTDQGDDEGVLFLVMEHVDGRTLRDLIREEAPLSPERALALLEPVLLALAEAHRSGIVHRDIKPENVLIANDGRVKVADFGLARAVNANSQHTRTGSVLIGTVSYLAPELIVNGRADPRADVYAAGVLLYEMLTGRKPHEGEGAIQIAYKHVNEDIPPPSEATQQRIPPYVDALVARATARDKDRRQADAKVFLQQVRRVRAALEAGELDDPELTEDLLPTAIVPVHGIDYVDDGTMTMEPVEARHGEADAGEATTVIAAGALVGGAPAPAAGAMPRLTGPREHDTLDNVEAAAATRTTPAVPPTGAGAPPLVPPRGSGRRPSAAAPVEPAAKPPRSRRSRRGLVLLTLLAVLVALAAYGGWYLGVGRYTSTPGVINLSVSDARAKVEKAGLGFTVAKEEFSETVTAGSVISTDPGAGSRILESGTVKAVVSKGPERYEVPKLRGVKFTEVAGLLEENNLTVGEVTEKYDEQVPDGVVVSASPSAGTELRRDTPVDVVVSKGPKPIRIPDFTGKSAERAEARLTELGFTVERSEENSDTVDKGDVISQDPDSGKGFKDDTVTLVVSKGPVLVQVPDLQAKSVSDATSELASLGLKVSVVRTQFYIGLDRVARQSPGSDEVVPKGSTVTIYVV